MTVAAGLAAGSLRCMKPCRAGNGRMGFLIGLDDVADADLGPQLPTVEMVQYFPLRSIGAVPAHSARMLIDRFREHVVAVGIEKSQRLGVGAKDAGANAQDEPAFEQIVEHRRV